MVNTSVQRGLFFTFRLLSLIRPGLRPVHLPRRGRLPPGGGFYTLSWERVAGRSPDGSGAVRRTDLVPPLFRRCGGTFPQGKVRDLRRGIPTLSWERVAGQSPDGCGAVPRTDLVPPLFHRRGGTFPQGKVRERGKIFTVFSVAPTRPGPGADRR